MWAVSDLLSGFKAEFFTFVPQFAHLGKAIYLAYYPKLFEISMIERLSEASHGQSCAELEL